MPSSDLARRAVVTGLGAVMPIGNDFETYWRNLQAGVTGTRLIQSFDASEFEVRIAAEVIGFEPWEDFPFNRGMLCPKGVKRYLQGSHPDRLLTALRRDPAAAGGFRLKLRPSQSHSFVALSEPQVWASGALEPSLATMSLGTQPWPGMKASTQQR